MTGDCRFEKTKKRKTKNWWIKNSIKNQQQVSSTTKSPAAVDWYNRLQYWYIIFYIFNYYFLYYLLLYLAATGLASLDYRSNRSRHREACTPHSKHRNRRRHVSGTTYTRAVQANGTGTGRRETTPQPGYTWTYSSTTRTTIRARVRYVYSNTYTSTINSGKSARPTSRSTECSRTATCDKGKQLMPMEDECVANSNAQISGCHPTLLPSVLVEYTRTSTCVSINS